MVIKYNMDNKSYYIRDLGDGSGTFVKIDVPLVNIYILMKILVTQASIYNFLWRLSYGGLVLK